MHDVTCRILEHGFQLIDFGELLYSRRAGWLGCRSEGRFLRFGRAGV